MDEPMSATVAKYTAIRDYFGNLPPCPEGVVPLEVTLPCCSGEVRRFRTEDELPVVDDICRHGNFWFQFRTEGQSDA